MASRLTMCLLSCVVSAGGATAAIGAYAGSAAEPRPAALAPAFEFAPLDSGLRVMSGFGDYRSNHFHAGLDFSTGGRVGRPVHAPLAGFVWRVRASGVGYGRSVYLEGEDGRLLVFGHLDAFAEPLASYVEAIQDSSGQYEQDLWPEAGRFRFRAGDVIAWTGESGGGGPHLHFEVRRGDMALYPLRAGVSARDTLPPRLLRVTLEPLDDTSSVTGRAAPVGFDLGRRDSVRIGAWGRLRAIVEAVDARSDGVWDISPWIVRLETGAAFVEYRFDSVSWATDMPEADYAYDRGRTTRAGTRSLVMWAPAGFRPRPMNASAPRDEEAGTLAVGAATREQAVTLWTGDLAGHVTRKTLVLAAARPRGRAVRVTGAAGAATGEWAPREHGWISAAGANGGEGPRERGRSADAVSGARLRIGPASGAERLALGAGCLVTFPAEALFDSTTLVLERGAAGRRERELTPASPTYALLPRLTPLRIPVEIAIAPAGGRHDAHVALYGDTGDGWEFLSAEFEPSRRCFLAHSRRPGRFALFGDLVAPRIQALKPSPRIGAGPYNRWALEARLADAGSGIDPRASFLRVDGRRVPSEWDSEVGVLRWRPVHAPAAGAHRCEIVAVDRVGNVARAGAGFVID